MIKFFEDSESNYEHRTELNAMFADATIAFCVNFDTSGEIMTKNFAKKYRKRYYQVDLNDISNIDLSEMIADMKKHKCHSINVAGNGIRRLNMSRMCITQETCDDIVYDVLSKLINEGVEIKSIRSGGQTGADESGLKAAEKLGIDSECLCPKGWRFYTMEGEIKDEELFKKRFE